MGNSTLDPSGNPHPKDLGRFLAGGHRPMMAMVEVTNRCNMDCPICYADARHDDSDVTLDEIKRYLDQLLAITRTPIPIQISGGEPSLRDDLPEIVALARQVGYRQIELITNGIRIGEEPAYLQRLKKSGLTAVYLQFDLPELLGLIETETGIGAETFLSDHLGHPACNAMSLVFVVDGRLEPLFKYIGKHDLAAFLGAERHEKIMATFAGKKNFFFRYLCNPKAWKLIAKAAPIFGTNPFNVLGRKNILLFAKAFMEKDRLDADRIARCCYGITGQAGVFSFCAYNNCHRFDDHAAVNAVQKRKGPL